MRKFSFIILCIVQINAVAQTSYRNVQELGKNWLFYLGDKPDAAAVALNDNNWEKVTVPHDWAITKPFDRNNDLQVVQVTDDGELKPHERTGRTGGLPYEGIGWYRYHLKFDANDKGKSFTVNFDGAMSNAKIYLNNRFVGTWPYGYASFNFDITKFINWTGANVLAVRLENLPESARWYPGAGIYRHVYLTKTNPLHIADWGTSITTPKVNSEQATVRIQTQLNQSYKNFSAVQLKTIIFDPQHRELTSTISKNFIDDKTIIQEFNILKPKLWSAENPNLYYAKSYVILDGKIVDDVYQSFGIRTITFNADKGMFVNGVVTKLKGVCLHHDLGALGAAINKSALRYRLQMLKEMGCNAIRGTHNPHAPEMLELCDEMGFYFIDEAFDEWKYPKVKNGYSLLFKDWVKKDIEAMVFRDRNHPALIMYSIGNEVTEQRTNDGGTIAKYLRDICHNADSTRPVTAGFNIADGAVTNGLAAAVDIPGWNYKPQLYQSFHEKYPNWVIYGSETGSTVSSRGAYQLPARKASMKIWTDNQSSSYDLEVCSWSQLPDTEWKYQEQGDFVAGEFVWTGFDYLGEPTPYSANWPSRSSYFGIIDLSGIPKDRYYLYQSHWSNKKMLHILPHWNWKGMEGKSIPVYAYTNYDSAELFINGKSFGKKRHQAFTELDSYRLRWENAVYEPGEIKVVAYDALGNVAETKVKHTAGPPAKLILEANTNQIPADEKAIAFVKVSVVDEQGNLCPYADDLITFDIKGNGIIKAVDNGNPASLEPFQVNYRKAFYGMCMVMIQSNNKPGQIQLTAKSNQIPSSSSIIIYTK